MITSILALGIIVASLIVGALGDGWNDKGKKIRGHAFKAAEIGILVGAPLILRMEPMEYIPYGISYIFMRIALFDYMYNIGRGNKLFYLGDSSMWDRFLKKQLVSGVTFARVIFLAAGIGVCLKEL